MPNSLSLIYKMYHFYENNWTQVYNKTFLYKKYKIAFRLMQISKKKTLQNVSFMENLLLNVQVYKPV